VTNSPLRVCHLGKYYPPAPGGMESHLQTLARAQASLGAEVDVVCVNHMDRHGKNLTWSRHGATDTLRETDGPVRLTRVGRSASFARLDVCPQLNNILRSLDRADIDILHVHTPNPTMLLALSAVRPDIPTVITHHSDIVRQRILRYALRPFEQMVYRRATTVFATSPAYLSRSNLLKRFASKVRSLPLGVGLQDYLTPSAAAHAHAEQLKREHGPLLWLAVGRCVYYKNFHVAIRALTHVPGKLIIVGHGPEENALKLLAKELGVSDRVIWRNYAPKDELVGAYLAAKALFFPSNARSEAFGLVQVEAMASGCPVINTQIDGSGVPWVSPHHVTGLTVPIDDAHAFADAANRLHQDPELRDRLSKAARLRAVEEFDHIRMGERSLSAYQAALSKQQRKARMTTRNVRPQPAAGALSAEAEAVDEQGMFA